MQGKNLKNKYLNKLLTKIIRSKVGGGLVCEFAYLRQEETESDEINRFPFGQTHVDSVK